MSAALIWFVLVATPIMLILFLRRKGKRPRWQASRGRFASAGFNQ